ncbi:MAG: acetyl-CoA hydrolase [Burkholderiales bacterium]|nr:acetyl-CoA hydrolase [Burkholderiales bacterium]MDE1926419.1 acetyl-CoA hydrolase [Burkholderiales bacterium]MDE2159319.1 acetyl-CoA hydrolase [Burkholderiales bacterium]MDE2503635.1 acetyl-CoA hydrolase [Burkholderiales bacterium]
MAQPRVVDSMEAAVDGLLAAVPGTIVLGLPLGIGKPNRFVNALYRRIRARPERRLVIVTALSLERPQGRSELERHFLEPLVERLFGDYPELDYLADARGAGLPPNIEVREFFFRSGAYLGHDAAQRSFIASNYTFVARDMVLQGVNAIAQAVAETRAGGRWRLSMSSNPDLSFEIAERCAAAGAPLYKVAVVNRELPYMGGGAEVAPMFYDLVVDAPEGTHRLFGPPNTEVADADYAIGLQAASLVADGGTLQIGIGSLGDAVARSLILRERENAGFRRLVDGLSPGGAQGRELGRFYRGLYGCSEMFGAGLLELIDAGIVRREVYGDLVLQQLINRGDIAPAAVSAATLQALLQAGRIRSPLTADDVAYLIRHGVFQRGVRLSEDCLVAPDGMQLPNDLRDPEVLAAIGPTLLGPRLAGGVVLTAGFFIGPQAFYERLRGLAAGERSRVEMTRIDFVNQLDGAAQRDSALRRAQRVKARFINTTMKVTLLGAAISDTLADGGVVSGVGGQYNFVAMAHALPDARSILMLRSTREGPDGPASNIVWDGGGNETIPRHLRDLVVTEYGVADLRGHTDGEVVKRLIAVADARFQEELITRARAAGKLEPGWELPPQRWPNTPASLRARLQPGIDAGWLPPYPFGTDLNADEQHIVAALKRLQQAGHHPVELVTLALRSLWEGREAPRAYLERLGIDEANSFKDLFIGRLFAGNL